MNYVRIVPEYVTNTTDGCKVPYGSFAGARIVPHQLPEVFRLLR